MKIGVSSAELGCCIALRNSYSGMACDFADAWAGTDAGAEARRTLRQRGSGLSRIADGAGEYWNSGRFGAVDRDRKVGGGGARGNCPRCCRGSDGALAGRFLFPAAAEGNL